MIKVIHRLIKLEKVLSSRAAREDQNYRNLLQLIAAAECHQEPGLDRVVPGDTDPATYREIQIILAEANWEHERALELEAGSMPEFPERPANLVPHGASPWERISLEMQWDRQHRWPRWREQARCRRGAVANARARLGGRDQAPRR